MSEKRSAFKPMSISEALGPMAGAVNYMRGHKWARTKVHTNTSMWLLMAGKATPVDTHEEGSVLTDDVIFATIAGCAVANLICSKTAETKTAVLEEALAFTSASRLKTIMVMSYGFARGSMPSRFRLCLRGVQVVVPSAIPEAGEIKVALELMQRMGTEKVDLSKEGKTISAFFAYCKKMVKPSALTGVRTTLMENMPDAGIVVEQEDHEDLHDPTKTPAMWAPKVEKKDKDKEVSTATATASVVKAKKPKSGK